MHTCAIPYEICFNYVLGRKFNRIIIESRIDKCVSSSMWLVDNAHIWVLLIFSTLIFVWFLIIIFFNIEPFANNASIYIMWSRFMDVISEWATTNRRTYINNFVFKCKMPTVKALKNMHSYIFTSWGLTDAAGNDMDDSFNL